MEQVARGLLDPVDGFLRSATHVIHDRDPLYTAEWKALLAARGVQSVATPAKSPNCNAVAERFIRTVREECLDHFVIMGERALTPSSERIRCSLPSGALPSGTRRSDHPADGRGGERQRRRQNRTPGPARRLAQLLSSAGGVTTSLRTLRHCDWASAFRRPSVDRGVLPGIRRAIAVAGRSPGVGSVRRRV